MNDQDPNETDELDTVTATATHVFTLRELRWIRAEAKRQHRSMSEIVRAAVDAAMARQDTEGGKAA